MADQTMTDAQKAQAAELSKGKQDAPQAGAESQRDDTTNGSKPEGQEPETFDREYVAKLRTEAASYRNRATNAEKALKKYEEEGLTELQKLERERDAAIKERDQLKVEVRRGAVISAAARAGAKYPDAVAKLVDLDADDVEGAVKEVRKAYPDMFRSPSADGGANGALSREDDMNSMIRRAAGRT